MGPNGKQCENGASLNSCLVHIEECIQTNDHVCKHAAKGAREKHGRERRARRRGRWRDGHVEPRTLLFPEEGYGRQGGREDEKGGEGKEGRRKRQGKTEWEKGPKKRKGARSVSTKGPGIFSVFGRGKGTTEGRSRGRRE
eukprot:8617053-Karenia_brevis.AAC.1